MVYKDFVRGIKRFLKSFISNGQKWKDIICKQQNRSAIQKQLLLMHHVIINVPLAKISTSDYLDIKFLPRCTTYLLYCITDNASLQHTHDYHGAQLTKRCNQHAMHSKLETRIYYISSTINSTIIRLKNFIMSLHKLLYYSSGWKMNKPC